MSEPDIRENTEDTESLERRFLDHYGLNVQPFGVTPDPRFLYLGSKHREALAALTYGTELNRGFLTLIAKPGMGKTSLLFQYLNGLRNKARTAFLFQTIGDARDLMCYLLADLGLDSVGKSLPEMHSMLNQFLMEQVHAGRRLVLVIDEAQNLDEKVLESVRQLSNFETPWMKLMQIVLAGQPQLSEQLARSSMAQLRQRISFSIRIEPLTGKEINAYIDHRLAVAGYKGLPLFSSGALALLAERSEGIPRNINNMCFCAMSLGWAANEKSIDREMMRDVLADSEFGSLEKKTEPPLKSSAEPHQIIQQTSHPPAVMVKGSSKSSLAVDVHFNPGQPVGLSTHDSAAVGSGPAFPPPEVSALSDPNKSVTDINSEATPHDTNPGVPLQDRAKT
jgi:general secretion pathway protein A